MYALAASDDGHWLAAGLGDTTVRIGRVTDFGGSTEASDAASSAIQARMDGHNYFVTAV